MEGAGAAQVILDSRKQMTTTNTLIDNASSIIEGAFTGD